MQGLAGNFAKEMLRVEAFLDVMLASVNLAKLPTTGFRSRHPAALAARSLQNQLRSAPSVITVVNDGAYLTVCAEFELTIRELIVRYVELAVARCPNYQHLPASMRQWYPRGCGELLVNLSQDKFKHLTQDGIHRSLANCLGSPSKPYTLIGDAFAHNKRNFWPGEVEGHFNERLGIPKVWQKLSRDGQFQMSLGTLTAAATETVAKSKLDALLNRRNDIVHRGKSYYTASDSEVRAAAVYCTELIRALADVLVNQLAAI